jgi:hypothetical protein
MVLFVVTVLLGGGCRSLPRPPMGTDLGPIVSRLETVEGHDRTRVLGGVGEFREGENGETLTACRPFTARMHDATSDAGHRDLLWPVGTIRKRAERLGWRFLIVYGLNDDVNDPNSRSHVFVFPLIYRGRSRDGELSSGFFPFYGVARDVGGVDYSWFVLFPLFGQSVDGETKSTVILWPFYRRALGPRDDQFRLWPFYGRHIREGRWEKRFIAWPFWTQSKHTKPGSEGSGWVLFPIYGRSDTGTSKLRMVIPPFFQYARWRDGYRVRAPWPLIEWSRDGADYKRKFWPLASTKRIGGTRRSYVLWPFFWRTVVERSGVVDTRHRAVPFLYSSNQRLTPEARPEQKSGQDLMLWPLFDYRRRGERSSTRMLYLWPLRRTRGVDRSWAPLWTLFSREQAGDRKETEVLWGMYRHSRDTESRRLSLFPLASWGKDSQNDEAGWDLLCGVLGRHRSGGDVSWRILFMGGNPSGQKPAADVPLVTNHEEPEP